jgi:alpha-beta hydrolase superfamily lysophospholipase
MTLREDCFPGHDRLPLFERSWLPAERPRAAIVLVHGLIEHSGCHAATALELVRQGFSVHALDLRGHGRSAGPRCDVRSFDQYLLDLDIFFERVRREAGDRSLFLMGNSMGGLLIALWAILRQPQIRGLVLSGPLLALAGGLYPRLRCLTTIAAAVVPGLRVARIPFDWLARRQKVVDRFRHDPLVFHGRFTVRMAAEILRAMQKVLDNAASLSVPLLILHGSQDRICDPAGSQALYQEAGCADKTFHLYEGFYHEVFDEPERERALADLTAWLDGHLPSAGVAACPNPAKT